MVLYKCEKCNKFQTHIKTHYIRHLNRKKNCDNHIIHVIKDNNQIEKIYKCDYCEFTSKHRQSYYRHKITCKEKPENKVNKLEKEIELLKKQQQNHIVNNNCNNTINNTNNTNNTINNNTYNITLNNYKKEDIDYITDEILYKLIKSPGSSLLNIIKYIHFNKHHPENHNLKLNNIQSKFIDIYNNGIWEKVNKKDIIEYERDNSYEIIDEYYTTSYPDKDKYEDRFKKFKKAFEGEDEQILKEQYDRIELLLYNSSKRLFNKK